MDQSQQAQAEDKRQAGFPALHRPGFRVAGAQARNGSRVEDATIEVKATLANMSGLHYSGSLGRPQASSSSIWLAAQSESIICIYVEMKGSKVLSTGSDFYQQCDNKRSVIGFGRGRSIAPTSRLMLELYLDLELLAVYHRHHRTF